MEYISTSLQDFTQGSYAATSHLALKLLTCSRCNSLLRSPITLTCGTSLCQHCIQSSNPLALPVQGSPMRLCRDIVLDKVTRWIDPHCSDQDAFEVRPSSRDSGYADSMNSKSPGETTAQDLSLLEILDCQICCQTLHNPVTTICGHTFCELCFRRVASFSSTCPMCRKELPIQFPAFSLVLRQLIPLLAPAAHSERLAQNAEDWHNFEMQTPVLICNTVFPGQRLSVHIFEPRYRTMMQRLLRAQRNQFGMCAARASCDGAHIGTWLEIETCEQLQDGRFLLHVIGRSRFRILRSFNESGYNIADVEEYGDEEQNLKAQKNTELNTDATGSEHSNQYFMDEISGFIHNVLPQANAHFRATSVIDSEAPSDPGAFSFWAASMLPVPDFEKLQVLRERSIRGRLLRIFTWVVCIQQEWWYFRKNSDIM